MSVALLILLVLAALMPARAQSESDACPPTVPALVAGEYARVTWETTLNLRPVPGLSQARVDVVREGALLPVLDAPVCAEGYRWWPLRHADQTVWAAESSADGETVYLEPRGVVEWLEDDDGVARAYVINDDGERIERAECMPPPEDYTQTRVNGTWLNQRTAAMLRHAERVYAQHPDSVYVPFEFLVMQGSYNAGGVAASFGTHDGGGAVDLSVRDPSTGGVMTAQIPLLLDALRVAGFAAWLRRPDELYKGSAIHIHAIAVGDAELSDAARRQIDGPEGYLRGFNGLPQPEGQPPLADADGAVVWCAWMRDWTKANSDLR